MVGGVYSGSTKHDTSQRVSSGRRGYDQCQPREKIRRLFMRFLRGLKNSP